MTKEEKIQAYIRKIATKHGISLKDAQELAIVKEYINNTEGDYEEMESVSVGTNNNLSINCS